MNHLAIGCTSTGNVSGVLQARFPSNLSVRYVQVSLLSWEYVFQVSVFSCGVAGLPLVGEC